MRLRLSARARRRLVVLAVVNGAIWLALFAADRALYARPALPVPHLATGGPWRPAPGPAEGRHALLISGGIRPSRNHARYWNNVSLLYCTLRERGWGDIEVAMADGSSAEPDLQPRSLLGMFGWGMPIDSSRDLDGDGRDDVSIPGTKAAIREALGRIGGRMQQGDELFVFLTDHGQLRRSGLAVRAVVLLWGDELGGAEFDRMMRQSVLAAARVTVLATQCHSRRFLDEVRRPGTVLMASGYPLWVYSDQYYSVFPYLFCRALLGRDPVTRQARGGPAADLTDAFERARSEDRTPEWPRTWTVPHLAANSRSGLETP